MGSHSFLEDDATFSPGLELHVLSVAHILYSSFFLPTPQSYSKDVTLDWRGYTHCFKTHQHENIRIAYIKQHIDNHLNKIISLANPAILGLSLGDLPDQWMLSMRFAAALWGLWAFGYKLVVHAYDPTDTLMDGGMWNLFRLKTQWSNSVE